jgi:putative cell wall-binding protein
VVLTEQTAGAVPTGYVCLSINMPSGSGAPNFTPSSRPLVTTGGNSATVSDGSGGSPGTTSGTTLGAGTTPTTLFFKVNTASTSATTYTVSGLKVDTGSALGALVIGIGTDPASPAAACANAASASPNLGTASPSGALDPLTRLWGNDRIATANAVSANSFPTAGSASAVVLTRSDVFADALAGGPLAVLKGGPLLLTGSTALDPTTETELKRVLAAGGTVYLLGGDAALAPVIAARLTALGFNPVRYGGGNRFETATIIASQGLSNPATVLLASGLDFPDALAGGAAAAKAGAAILLTEGSGPAPETTTYLAGHTGDTKYALGGPAAAAYPSASPLVGVDRYETSVKIANQFFASPAVVGIASGSAFPDALTGAPHIGRQGGPLLLVQLDVVPASVRSYLSNNAVNIGAAFSYGGPAVTSDATLADVQNAISGH